ncbi:unnamed protein product [Cercopithifilaria johnstoni]|uniref:C2H2-type domain-containing protein n=1 Tax=Cercopithifilaria johnstoni TaxID=2874296 RepID=A0A8J2PPC8_9BILA|nr:unnamed protein product [Cercopithifilaria johnstoni]
MFASYYMVVIALPLYIAQITVSNDGSLPIQAGIRNGKEITTVTNGSKTKEKWSKCVVCDKQFGYTGNMIRHMRIHTGEKNFISTQINAPKINAPIRMYAMRASPSETPYEDTYERKDTEMQWMRQSMQIPFKSAATQIDARQRAI